MNTSFVFIGAGNLAVNLAKDLYRKGFKLLQIYSRTEESAKSLATRVDASWTTDLDEVVAGADVYVVSLTDAAFVELLPRIIKNRENSLFVHTAGSIPMNVWEGKLERYGVFYPLQTFSKQREVTFDEIPIFIETANEEDLSSLRHVAQTLSSRVYEIDSAQRKSLHLAAVFACNFTNHMYALGADILEKNGLPFDVLLPLIDEAARKVHHLAPKDAQTGPAVRYDENVINAHLEMLSDAPCLQQIYHMLSESIHHTNT